MAREYGPRSAVDAEISGEGLLDRDIASKRKEIRSQSAERAEEANESLKLENWEEVLDEMKNISMEKYMELARQYINDNKETDEKLKNKLDVMKIDVDDLKDEQALSIIDSLGEDVLKKIDENEEYKRLVVMERQLSEKKENISISDRAIILSEFNERSKYFNDEAVKLENEIKHRGMTPDEKTLKQAELKELTGKIENVYNLRESLAEKIDSRGLSKKTNKKMVDSAISESSYVSQSWGFEEVTGIYDDSYKGVISKEDMHTLNELGYKVSAREKSRLLRSAEKILECTKNIIDEKTREPKIITSIIKGEKEIFAFIENQKKVFNTEYARLQKGYKEDYLKGIEISAKDAVMQAMVSEKGSGEIAKYYDGMIEERLEKLVKKHLETKYKNELEKIEGKGNRKIMDVLGLDPELFKTRLDTLSDTEREEGLKMFVESGFISLPNGLDIKDLSGNMKDYKGWTDVGRPKSFIESIIEFLTDKKGGLSKLLPKAK